MKLRLLQKFTTFYTKLKKKSKVYSFNYLKNEMIKLGANKVDYVGIYNVKKNFKRSKKFNKDCRIFIAYYIKNVRLIDNI